MMRSKRAKFRGLLILAGILFLQACGGGGSGGEGDNGGGDTTPPAVSTTVRPTARPALLPKSRSPQASTRPWMPRRLVRRPSP
jgi:hypothetical protein